jgi:hypothetical protein
MCSGPSHAATNVAIEERSAQVKLGDVNVLVPGGSSDVSRRLCSSVGVTHSERDFSPGLCQCPRRLYADARCRSGDDRLLAREIDSLCYLSGGGMPSEGCCNLCHCMRIYRCRVFYLLLFNIGR